MFSEQISFTLSPSANPDGYEYSINQDRYWRKNRAPNSGSSCYGTDLNRNWAFHWGETGVSFDPCSEIYCGGAAFDQVFVHFHFCQSHKLSTSAWICKHPRLCHHPRPPSCSGTHIPFLLTGRESLHTINVRWNSIATFDVRSPFHLFLAVALALWLWLWSIPWKLQGGAAVGHRCQRCSFPGFSQNLNKSFSFFTAFLYSRFTALSLIQSTLLTFVSFLAFVLDLPVHMWFYCFILRSGCRSFWWLV